MNRTYWRIIQMHGKWKPNVMFTIGPVRWEDLGTYQLSPESISLLHPVPDGAKHVREGLFLEEVENACLLWATCLPSPREDGEERGRPKQRGRAEVSAPAWAPGGQLILKRKTGETGPHRPGYSSQIYQAENSLHCLGAE